MAVGIHLVTPDHASLLDRVEDDVFDDAVQPASYVPGPGCPEPFYRSLGFAPNGEVDDGEVVLVLPL